MPCCRPAEGFRDPRNRVRAIDAPGTFLYASGEDCGAAAGTNVCVSSGPFQMERGT